MALTLDKSLHPLQYMNHFLSHLHMCNSCQIRHLPKRWKSRRTWNICFILDFQLKKIRSKTIQITLIELWSFISFELRHLNSMKMSQKAKFGCSIFQLKIKRKQIFQVRHQFGHFVKCRIWHESHKSVEKKNFIKRVYACMHACFRSIDEFYEDTFFYLVLKKLIRQHHDNKKNVN